MALIKPEQLRSGFYDITGSLFGTSSYASYALTASYALNGGGGTSGDPFRIVTGSISASVNIGSTIFLIKSASKDILSINNTGIITLATQSSQLTTPAPNGGIYFTSNSFFVGLD
jgi:hypothetical protein